VPAVVALDDAAVIVGVDDHTVHALRVALASDRRAWQDIERIVREYVRVLRAHDLKAERAVAAAKTIVTEATGDPMSSMIPSVVTWTLSEYYEK